MAIRVRLSEFKKIINKFLIEALEEMQELETEDTDRLRRHADGYGDDMEEDVDRVRRHNDGYGDDFEEALDVADDDDVMTYNNAYDASFKGGDPKRGREGTRDDPRHAASHAAGNTALANKLNKKYHNKDEALGSSGVEKPKPATSSAALHTRDKSQMQGVGPRPTMATAFGNENQPPKKEAQRKTVRMDMDTFEHPNNREPFDDLPDDSPTDPYGAKDSKDNGVSIHPVSGKKPGDYRYDGGFGRPSLPKKESEDPNKTAVLTPGQRPNGDEAEKQFMAGQKAKRVAANKESIKQISHQQQQQMQKDGWKFDKHPSGEGNWTATPPANKPVQNMGESAPPTEKAEDFINKSKDDFKKRYGARWKTVLYATANEKFGKKK